LYVHSTAPETDIVARLSWLRADGSARFLTLGATSLSRGEAAVGGATRLRLRFGPFALALSTGEGLRLDVASSAFPLIARDPNTGADPLAIGSVADFRLARQTLFHDADRPSCLLLPELP
jgi:predicted acyl esterase